MVEFNKKEKLFNLKGIAVRIYQSYKKKMCTEASSIYSVHSLAFFSHIDPTVGQSGS
jgi:hypothetical protein